MEAPGWDSRFKVSYELRLGPDGQLLALNDLRQEVPKGKKTVIAPLSPCPPRSSAPPASLRTLCDNTSYLLGADEGQPERSASASRPVRPSPQRCSTVWTPCRQSHPRLFLTAGSRILAPTHPLLAGQWANLNNNRTLCSATNPRRLPLAGHHR